MTRRSRSALLCAMVVTVLSACASTVAPAVGGETNWLKACTSQRECGEGSCLCGVCTIECRSTSACRGSFAGECLPTSSSVGASTCAGSREDLPSALCLPTCESDASCGDGFVCRTGACLTVAAAALHDSGEGIRGLDGSSPDSRCLVSSSPCSGADAHCTWGDAEPLIAACVMRPQTPYYAVRCGPYDGLVSQGTDSAKYFYYDDAGKLLAWNEVGLSALGCLSYDASFTLPEACDIVTPECPDAGSE